MLPCVTPFIFTTNKFRIAEKKNVMPAGAESCAGAVGGGGGLRHVQGLRGTGALHAHQRHRLLERMERLGVLHPAEQQRYRRASLPSDKL